MAKRGSSRALLGALAWCAAAGAAVAACAGGNQPVPGKAAAAGGEGAGGAAGGGGATGSGAATGESGGDDGGGGPLLGLDASSICGDQVHQVITDPPNLYFVFDVSSSMGNAGGGGFTKYQRVEHGALEMIEALGPLINVGAAVFPFGMTAADACSTGAEVLPVSPGDPIGPMTGPTTEGFIVATSVTPSGGTPTAATLTALTPGILALEGKTVVILSTDGGPNCNALLGCAAAECIPNIEGVCNPPTTNCCDPAGSAGPQGCLDHDAAVAAVATLAGAGVPVFIVGVPGSDLYAAVLDDMAVAGGQPQPGSPSYYQVDDLDNLSQVFETIASAFVSCDLVLVDPPPDEDHTNVYFDGAVVPGGAGGGWIWTSPSEIEIVGDTCTRLKSGRVREIEVVSGCPTQPAT